MTGHRGHPMHMQYSSREYDCNVTFLKVSDISVPLQSRSFPSAGSPPESGALRKRFLKLTTLYGTGQQEIGEFQISGSECDIQQRRTYKFVSTDSVSVTKLHIYVDEVFNSGLTGHVTIDVTEFIGEDDSEIYLEYPLSASSPRHRAAKLQVAVQCKGPPGPPEDDNDVLDMDLETFLYDEFPESFLESSDIEPEAEHIPHPAGSVGENNPDELGEQPGCGPLFHVRLDGFQSKIGESNPDALDQQQGYGALSQIPSLKDFEGDFLGLDTILKDFVAENAQTRPFLVTGGQRNKAKDQKHPTKSDLHAAVFFAAGVTMQQRLQSLEAESEGIFLRMQESVDHGVPLTTGSRVLVRSQSDEFDVKRVLSSPEMPKPEVVAIGEEATLNALRLNESPFSACRSPSPGNSETESVQVSTAEAKGRGRSYVQSHDDFVVCPTCSTARSRIQGSLPFDGNLSPADEVCDGSTAATIADEEEKQSPIPVSSSRQPERSAVVVVRNILGILFIAGVFFGLGVGAHGGGFLGTTRATSADSDASKWSEILQMGAWTDAESANSQPFMQSPSLSRMPTVLPLNTPLIANKIDLRERQLQEGHRKIVTGLSSTSTAGTRNVEVLREDKSQEVRDMDGTREAYLDNVPAGHLGEGAYITPPKQVDVGPLSLIQQNARIEQPADNRAARSFRRRLKDHEELVGNLPRKIRKRL